MKPAGFEAAPLRGGEPPSTRSRRCSAEGHAFESVRWHDPNWVRIVTVWQIFDGLDGWGSHVAYVVKGEMKYCQPVEAIVFPGETAATAGGGGGGGSGERWHCRHAYDGSSLAEQFGRELRLDVGEDLF